MLAFKTELYALGVGNNITLKVKGKDGKEKDIIVKLVSESSK